MSWAEPDADQDEVIARLQRKIASLDERWSRALHALTLAPWIPRWPRTDYSKWFWGTREQAIRGERDRLADAMDLTGREVRREEVCGCCERHPMPPLIPATSAEPPTSNGNTGPTSVLPSRLH